VIAEYILRFVIGGVAVSIFAVLSDICRPKSFAGLFGAAPSIALATLGLTIWNQGSGYAAIEGRSMIIGALAFGFYSVVTCQLIKRLHFHSLASTILAGIAWFSCAFLVAWLLLS
jgi:Protein of unknown function (DUF3147)